MTLTITLAPEEEAKLHQKAMREGLKAEVVAHDVLVQALDWEAQDRAKGRLRRASMPLAMATTPFAMPASSAHTGPAKKR